jgi:hypothetical protein
MQNQSENTLVKESNIFIIQKLYMIILKFYRLLGTINRKNIYSIFIRQINMIKILT